MIARIRQFCISAFEVIFGALVMSLLTAAAAWLVTTPVILFTATDSIANFVCVCVMSGLLGFAVGTLLVMCLNVLLLVAVETFAKC
jgi:hypothetical protein